MSNKPEFTLRRFGVLAYNTGFTLWVYRHVGELADVCADHFFDPAADMIAARDHIHVTGSDGGAMLWVASSTEAAGVVTKRMAST